MSGRAVISVSDIAGEYARVLGAYSTPTLTLLHQRLAPAVVAIFRSSFSRDTRAISAALFHEQVDTYLTELKLAGITQLPSASGRDLCRQWVRGQWLVRNPEGDGTESYSLTSHARDALETVARLTRDRASLSEHRIATIVSTVQRFNADINPDRQARVAILQQEIAERAAECDRLLSGGELATVTADYVATGFHELLQLIADLPGDFARVQEAFTRLRQDILADFRNETRGAGEVVDDYLRRAEDLMTATAEGRAFEGAFALLRDDAVLHRLRENLTALLEHELAGALLDNERSDLRGLVALIRVGMETVLAQRNKATATLREHIVSHDVAQDRELDSLLRQLDAELTTWLETAGPRAVVPLSLPEQAEVEHLRERFHDPVEDAPPPPLETPVDDTALLSLEQLRAQGGPTFDALRGALHSVLAGPDPMTTLGRLFGDLDPSLRRPVEIFGLLQVAMNEQALHRLDSEEEYVAVRPDGTTRRLSVPTVAPRPRERRSPPPARAAPTGTTDGEAGDTHEHASAAGAGEGGSNGG
jgi:hypothetical protein